MPKLLDNAGDNAAIYSLYEPIKLKYSYGPTYFFVSDRWSTKFSGLAALLNCFPKILFLKNSGPKFKIWPIGLYLLPQEVIGKILIQCV